MRVLTGILLLAAACATAQALPGKWSLEVGRDPVTWENTATLSVKSETEIANENGSAQVRPQLDFRCRPGGDGTISARIDWQRYISSFNTEVGFKAGDRQLLLVNWGVDKSKKITQPRSTSDSRELMAYIAGASKLQVEVIPYSEKLISIDYDISGIDEALKALAAQCAGR